MTTVNVGTRVVTIWGTYGDYHVARLAALAEQGFEVVPFAHSDYLPAYPVFRAKPDSLIVVNRGAGDRINPVTSGWRTWLLLRIYRPDIVLTTGYERSESLAAWLYARMSHGKGGGRPVVIVMLDNRAVDHPRSRVIEIVKSVYLRVFDGFLASGSDTRDYLAQLRVPKSKIQLGYNCVDNERIASLVAHRRTTKHDASQTRGYFLCIGRLIAVKNIPCVLRAYHAYLQWLPVSEPPVPLVIGGDGPEREAIEDLIHRLGLGNLVSLVGELVGIEAVATQLAFCKTFIFASTGDLWGLVVNEAMAAGCPVLVSRQCGSARDLVEQGVNGFTFDAGNSDELAQYMLWLHMNDNLLEAMGGKSKEIVDRFTPMRFVASVRKLTSSAGGSAAKELPMA